MFVMKLVGERQFKYSKQTGICNGLHFTYFSVLVKVLENLIAPLLVFVLLG